MSILRISCLIFLCLLAWSLPAVEAVMAKRGNIRFGPSIKDDIVCTLNADTPIHILGKPEGMENWFKIKFPSQGHAWVHGMNLVQTDKERILRVTTNGTNVRRDATKGGEVVIKLNRNDEVRWQGPKVGQWYAVYVPNAEVYVHASVVHVEDEAVAKTPVENSGGVKPAPTELNNNKHAHHPTQQLWKKCIERYESYYQQYQADNQKGLTLDWMGLSVDLQRVVQDHPELRTRIKAKRLFIVIQRVVSSSGQSEPLKLDESVSSHTAAQEEENKVSANLDSDTKVVTKQPVVKTEPEETTDIRVINKKGVVGWLQKMEVPSIGVDYAILGDNGISAFIKLADGVEIDLNKLHWKRVRADGDKQIVDHEVDPQYKGIPLIIVKSLELVK